MTVPRFDPASLGTRLLGRPPIGDDAAQARQSLAGKRILVTGAGGSVGTPLSELLSDLRPPSLVLLDHHENSLFQLRQRHLERCQAISPRVRFVLADHRDERKMAAVLQEYAPDVIFHLAAYKHVQIAEEMPEECVSNNVLGTWTLLKTARDAGVERFVYPSTDKAVDPANVYGATKRVVEALLLALAESQFPVRTTAVRLVNVLGAHGGVIETFARQIADGRELTITDPEMTRYWITMDEALYLLLQAAVSNDSGNVLILDIGEPVRVGEIARRLWVLLGTPGQPLPARYLGPRPGERRDEYLLNAGETTRPGSAAGILEVVRPRGSAPTLDQVMQLLRELERLVASHERDRLRDSLFAFDTALERQS